MPWIEEYFQSYVKDTQVIESDYSRNGDKTTVSYKVIIANYDVKQVGSLISYDVKLNFTIIDGASVYVLNPDISLELYDNMVDDYARYLVTANYNSKQESEETNPTVVETDPVTKESVTSPDENNTTETTVAPTPTTTPKKSTKKKK